MGPKIRIRTHDPRISTLLHQPLQHLSPGYPQRFNFCKLQNKLTQLRDVTGRHRDVTIRHEQTQEQTWGTITWGGRPYPLEIEIEIDEEIEDQNQDQCGD